MNTAGTLGKVVGEYPSVGVDIVDEAIELLDADNPTLRNNALGLITDIVLVHTDVAEPHVETIGPLLDAEDTYTRINASGALSRVAEDFPASVRGLTGKFVAPLTDNCAAVRENACWTGLSPGDPDRSGSAPAGSRERIGGRSIASVLGALAIEGLALGFSRIWL